MITKVYDYVKKYHMIHEGDTIIAGVSGGADSVCLLFMLIEIRKKIDFDLSVVHINHGIREDAAADEAYVRKLCKEQNIPFYLKCADVRVYAKEQGFSEEEAGRKIRYQAFEEVLQEKNGLKSNGKIAVAHNSNDCAETILFHLMRGTGLRGLGGIRPVNDRIIRPILCLERTEIESFLSEREIAYCHDCTNEQDTYTRNRIRHHILPYAEQAICKGAVGHISRAGEYLQQAEDFIQRQTIKARQRCCQEVSEREVIIDITLLRQEDVYLQKQILLSALWIISPGRKDITSAHIDSIEELLEKAGCKEINLPYGIIVCKEYDRVTLKRKASENNIGALADNGNRISERLLEGEAGEIPVPELGTVRFRVFSLEKTENIPQKKYTKWFDYDKIKQLAIFRRRRQGDYLTINQQMNKQSLQDYLVNQKISRSKREEMYFMSDGSHIMWVPGYRISEHYKVTEDTVRVLEVTVKELHT